MDIKNTFRIYSTPTWDIFIRVVSLLYSALFGFEQKSNTRYDLDFYLAINGDLVTLSASKWHLAYPMLENVFLLSLECINVASFLLN